MKQHQDDHDDDAHKDHKGHRKLKQASSSAGMRLMLMKAGVVCSTKEDRVKITSVSFGKWTNQ